MDDFRDIVERYLAGELSPDEHTKLSHWLQAAEANRRAFLAEVDFYRTVRNVLIQKERDLANQAEAQSTDPDPSPGEALPVPPTSADGLTRQQYVSALSYVIRHTFTPRRMIGGAIAAALAIGAALAVVLLTGPEPQPQQRVVEGPAPVAADQPAVATLSSEHGAVWASSTEGSLTPGSDLRAGQRITLTRGFAEITTKRGAIAILEAPTTIEFVHNDNAIRLHAGKLVGICETQASKGLVVHAPGMDITDIGTRFGLHAINPERSELYVFEGEVEVRPASITTKPRRAIQGQALTVGPDGSVLDIETQTRFTQTMPGSSHEATAIQLGAQAYFRFDPASENQQQLKNVVESNSWSLQPLDQIEWDRDGGPLSEQDDNVSHSPYFSGESSLRIDSGSVREDGNGPDYTIALWIKPQHFSQVQNVFALTGKRGPTKEFSNQLVLTAEGRLAHYIHSQNDKTAKNQPTIKGKPHMQVGRSALPLQRWTHVAVSCSNGGDMKLYVNGLPDADPLSLYGIIWNGSHYLLSGQAGYYDTALATTVNIDGFQGGLDELAFFDRQLDDREVMRLFRSASSGGDPAQGKGAER